MPERSPLATAAGIDRVLALMAAGEPLLGDVTLVTVDGPSGSGKSTFADRLAHRLQSDRPSTVVVSTDLLATWDDPFGWWPRLESGLLQPLSEGRTAVLDRVEWSTGVPLPAPPLRIEPPAVLILEGVSAGRAAVEKRTTVAVWVEVAHAALRLERAVGRDGESSRALLQRWQQQEQRHFGRDGTADRAAVRVDPTA